MCLVRYIEGKSVFGPPVCQFVISSGDCDDLSSPCRVGGVPVLTGVIGPSLAPLLFGVGCVFVSEEERE